MHPVLAAALLTAWASFTKEHGQGSQHEFSIAESRSRPAGANGGAKRGRKPKVAA